MFKGKLIYTFMKILLIFFVLLHKLFVIISTRARWYFVHTSLSLYLYCGSYTYMQTFLFDLIFCLEWIHQQPSVWHVGYPLSCHYCVILLYDVMQIGDCGADWSPPSSSKCNNAQDKLASSDWQTVLAAAQPRHNCRHFFFFFNFNSELGDGFALTSPRRDCGPLKPLSPLVLVVRSSSARLMLTYVKNYTSPKLSQSAPASHWLLAAAAAPENEWNWNSCYITCTIPGSAVLHSIILYQNGHSGTEPPQIVSTTTFPERSRFVCFCMLSVHLKTLKFPDISQHDYQHIYTCNAHSTDGDNVSGCESALKKSYIYSWRGGGGGFLVVFF